MVQLKYFQVVKKFKEMTRPRIIFIVPSNLSDLQEKGVEQMIWERDEDGFFERVVTLHPFTNLDQVIDHSDVHRIYEIGRFSSTRWLHLAMMPISLIRIILKTVRIIREEKIDIIRGTDPFYCGFIAWAASRLSRNCPFCISIHSDYDKRYELDGMKGLGNTGFRFLLLAVQRFV